MELSPIQYFTISIIPVLLAITVHEAAHGYAAKHFGDKTAYYLGRITLNPIKHIDPLGTVVIPGMLLLLSAPFLFGWAKPVPVNFSNLNNPKKDMMWVVFVGPASNLVMVIIWAIILGLFKSSGTSHALFVIGMAQVGIMINLVLMLLNLLPIPPLDGGRMAVSLLPSPWSYKLASIERYGMFILIFLIVSGLLSAILLPLLRFFQGTLIGIFV
jgi:Zn-dependent protease